MHKYRKVIIIYKIVRRGDKSKIHRSGQHYLPLATVLQFVKPTVFIMSEELALLAFFIVSLICPD